MCCVSALRGKIKTGYSNPVAARRQMWKTELRAEAALVWCHRFLSLTKSFVIFFELWSQMSSVGGNFSSLCYEGILHKTSIAVKCWGLLVGEGIVLYRGLQSSTDGNSTSHGSVPFLIIAVCFFSKCFLLRSRKANGNQSVPFQVPLAAFFLDALQLLVAGQGRMQLATWCQPEQLKDYGDLQALHFCSPACW